MIRIEPHCFSCGSVRKITTRSIYAKSKNSEYEVRFDKKTRTSKTMIGYTGYIWLSPDDYWNSVKRNKDKKALRSRIAGELSNLSLEKLHEVADLLGIKLN